MPRFIDAPLTDDTGNPGAAGPPVVDMGAFEFGTDCNGNGVPDSCDLDCQGKAGQCAVLDCETSIDCNGNDIPDECDIAAGTSAVVWSALLAPLAA